MNELDFEYDLNTCFSIQTGNVTNVNHLIPANYYQKWTKATKKARNEKITLSNTQKPVELQDFMSRKFIITQDLEKLFTSHIIDGKKYDTENIKLLKKLQKHISEKNIDSFYYSSIDKKIYFNDNKKINKYETQHLDEELENFSKNLIELKLYLAFFKARLSLWEFSEKIASDTTKNLLNIIIKVIEKNQNNNGLYFYKRTIDFILQFVNNQRYLEKYIKKEITKDELQKNLITKNYVDKLIELKNKKQTIEFLKKITNFLEINKYEDSLFAAHINSEFFKDFLETIKIFSLKNSSIILSTNLNLTTGESPMVTLKLSKDKTKQAIKKLVENKAINQEYLKNDNETEIFLMPYSKNILIIESEDWYLDFLLNFIKTNQHEKVINFYEKIKHTHNIDNDYQILTNI